MAYCGPKGIALSVFLSWPEADQQAALAWQAHEGRRCGGCGTHPDDWLESKGGDRNAFHAELRRCPGCIALDNARNSQDAQGTGVHASLAAGDAGGCPRCNHPPAHE